jgi:hypothetical protein
MDQYSQAFQQGQQPTQQNLQTARDTQQREMTQQGYSADQIQQAIAQGHTEGMTPANAPQGQAGQQAQMDQALQGLYQGAPQGGPGGQSGRSVGSKGGQPGGGPQQSQAGAYSQGYQQQFNPNAPDAGTGAAQSGYDPSIQQFGMTAAQGDYDPKLQQYNAQAAQTGYKPNLQDYSMQAAQIDPATGNPKVNDLTMAGPQMWNAQQAQAYADPYQQGVTDIAKREAARDAKLTQLNTDMGAARQGTYGGSRQLLATLNRERDLGQNLSDIQTKGLQSAYENAQQQFERDRSATTDVGKTNLQSLLTSQQLRTTTGQQAALANLSSQQQANTQNLAAKLQTQGLNADQAMKAALANQGAYQTAQQSTEQSRQFGASNALAGYGQAGQMAQTLANIGQGQFQTDQTLRDKQMSTATLDQAMQQQYLDQQYQDYLRQQGYPLEMLQQYSSLLRGVPVAPNTVETGLSKNPSISSQILGTGLGALGAYKALSG